MSRHGTEPAMTKEQKRLVVGRRAVMTWDRFDICEAYAVLEWDWHSGGWLHERPSNVRRGRARGYVGEATSIQLTRIQFKPRPNLSYETLEPNGRAIYDAAVIRLGLKS
jgi:hypothetical protein